MLDLLCVMTENCNLRCEHCYMSASPGKKDTTVTSENFQQILSHLPNIQTRVGLTGGEIFTVEDSLRNYLDLIEKENKKRIAHSKINIGIQTNGFWLKRENAADMLDYLRSKQVHTLDIASNDRHHKKEGLKLDDSLIELARIYLPVVVFRGVENAIPIGRASGKPAVHKNAKRCQGANQYENSVLTIRNNGKVYPCCYPFFEYEGNIFQENLVDILKRANKDPRLTALNENGLRGIACYDGFDSKKVNRLIDRYGSCGACAKIYGASLK